MNVAGETLLNIRWEKRVMLDTLRSTPFFGPEVVWIPRGKQRG